MNLITKKGIDIDKVVYYTLRDTKMGIPYFLFIDRHNRKYEIPVTETVECIFPGCLFCEDYMGKSSDISFSVLGAPKGYSLLFIRTKKGEEALATAIDKKYLKVKKPKFSVIEELIANLCKILPTKFYLTLSFKLFHPIAAELMAKYKLFLNKYLYERGFVLPEIKKQKSKM